MGAGLAWLGTEDEPVAELGDELAIARALTDLANQLLVTTQSDIEAATYKPVTGLHLQTLEWIGPGAEFADSADATIGEVVAGPRDCTFRSGEAE